MGTGNIPAVECQMMIRKPVSEVFQAFIDPSITTKFGLPSRVAGLKLARPSFGNGKCIMYPQL